MNAKHRETHIPSLTILTAILGALPSVSFAGVEWTQQADMLTPRVALSCSVVDGKIYAIGGKPVGYTQNRLATVEQYDPIANQWTRKANMPAGRANISTSVVDGKIYAIGGYMNGGSPRRKLVEVYDPVTDTWARKTDMLIGEADHSSATVDGKIYVIGGSTVQIYNPLTDTWTRGADRPSLPRWWAPVSVVGGKIYSIGGAGDGSTNWRVVPTVEEYDPATNTWTAKNDMPTARASHASVVLDGRAYVINGDAGGSVFSIVEVYDPATDTWMEAPPTAFARQLPSACVVDGTIYLMGGFNPSVDRAFTFRTVEVLDLNPIVDFNGDGAVDIDDLLTLTESWGLDDPLVDIGPMPWGDGIVDARDVFVLAGYMVEWASEANDIQ